MFVTPVVRSSLRWVATLTIFSMLLAMQGAQVRATQTEDAWTQATILFQRST